MKTSARDPASRIAARIASPSQDSGLKTGFSMRFPLAEMHSVNLNAERRNAGTATKKKQGNETRQRRPKMQTANKIPVLPNVLAKQQMEKDRKKPNVVASNGRNAAPGTAKPSKIAAIGYRK